MQSTVVVTCLYMYMIDYINIAIPCHEQVNNNGVLSFDAPVPAYTPEPLPISGSRVLLSPYWADVDTRSPDGGLVYYRNASSDQNLLRNAGDQIRAAFPDDFPTFRPTFLFIATWDHVGYYNSHSEKVHRNRVGDLWLIWYLASSNALILNVFTVGNIRNIILLQHTT